MHFLLANARLVDYPVVFVSAEFASTIGYSRTEVLGKSCLCPYLHGPLTHMTMVNGIREACDSHQSQQVEIILYKRNRKYHVHFTENEVNRAYVRKNKASTCTDRINSRINLWAAQRRRCVQYRSVFSRQKSVFDLIMTYFTLLFLSNIHESKKGRESFAKASRKCKNKLFTARLSPLKISYIEYHFYCEMSVLCV